MRKTRSLLTAFFLSASLYGYGQNINGSVNEVEDSHSPSAGKGGSGSGGVGVDNYTGTASINIPIYNYSVDGINSGISLGYTAKGIRVDEIASSVGLGWNLNAGGSIVREVYGIEDEVTLVAESALYSVHDSFQGILLPPSQTFYTGSYDDPEHDVFHVNLDGDGFSFMIAIDSASGTHYVRYKFMTSPRRQVKIEIFTKDWVCSGGNCGWTNIRPGIGRKAGISMDQDVVTFVITDEKDNKYYFERGDVLAKKFELEELAFNPDTATYYPIQKWVLDKVVTNSGNIIKYTYARNYMEYHENTFEVLNVKQPEYNGSQLTYDPMEFNKEIWKGYKSHIQKIEYPNGTTVTFDISNASDSRCDCKNNYIVKGIDIENIYDVNVKNKIRYAFAYEYFNTPRPEYNLTSTIKSHLYANGCGYIFSDFQNIPSGAAGDKIKENHLAYGLRLKLKAITRVGTDGTTTEPYYSFDYNMDYALPLRFSPYKDIYGYYNGKTSSTQSIPYIRESLAGPSLYDTFYTSIPLHTDPNTNAINAVWGQDRGHDHTYAQAFCINTLKNAYGGKTTLEFQNYTAVSPDSAYGYHMGNGNGGYEIDPAVEYADVNDGLCIYKITNIDQYNSDFSTQTVYTLSGGQKFYRGGYTWYPTGEGNVYTNSFIDPQTFVNGSNHGFSEITVKGYGFNNEQLSHIKYSYSNLMYRDGSNNLLSNLHKRTGFSYHTMHGTISSFRMGLLLKSETFDKDGYKVDLRENQFEEVSYGPVIDNDRSFTYGTDVVNVPYQPLPHEATRLTVNTITRYINDGGYKTFSGNYVYTYDDFDNLRTTSWTSSEGKQYKKINRYSYDYIGQFGYNAALDTMSKRGMQERLSTEIWVYGSGDSSLLSYNLKVPLVVNGYVRYPASFSLASKDPLPSAQALSDYYINRASAFNFKTYPYYGSHFEKLTEDTRFDDRGEVLETRTKDLDIYAGVIKDTRRKTIASANAKNNEIAYTSFEDDYVTNADMGNWNFEPGSGLLYSAAGLTKAMTGNYVWKMYGTSDPIYSNQLPAKKYILSFWTTATTQPPVTMQSSSVTCTLQNTVGQWKLYTATLEATNNAVVVIYPFPIPTQGPAPSYCIDELRLHPAESSMTSYTHKPLFGIGSINGADNYVIYHEYDAFGKHFITRDMRGNIVVKKETLFNDPDGTGGNSGTSGGSSSY